jgi:hypothetical protein
MAIAKPNSNNVATAEISADIGQKLLGELFCGFLSPHAVTANALANRKQGLNFDFG